ncbi:MAG TPA: 6-carboxytetrahydropterin synthase [Hyphomicrobiales bacterium]|nr:6-carboxytetrahydropterin synthase [Hyphomicrobiales bacterium]
MYAVEVRDHIMVAHSLPGEVFGPAQRRHGATFIVDVAFLAESLGRDRTVVDIGRAAMLLREVLAPLSYADLDKALPGELTTTEYLCRLIFDRMAEAALGGRLGRGGQDLAAIRVTLHESHLARAWYEGPLGRG